MEICSSNKIFTKNQSNIEQTIKDFDEIDFSLILRRSFNVTLDQNNQIIKKGNFNLFNKNIKLNIQKKKYKLTKSNMSSPLKIIQSMNRMDENQNKSIEDLSLIAGKIVTNALHIPRSLFCPFCADEYMFEFTLKDHLKRKHTKELTKRQENDLPESDQTLEDENNHLCPYCNAVFYIYGLVPKHVANYHGRNWLQHWQQTFGKKLYKNFTESTPDTKDPSIIYAACSPGLSDIFDKLITKDSDSLLCTSVNNDTPQLKSILKKTPNRNHQPATINRIINSPSSMSIRRNKSEIIKRSVSVRRELRFDLPPLKISPNNSPIIRKHRKLHDLWRLFRFRKNKNFSSDTLNSSKGLKKMKKRQKENLSQENIITSTPINFLDETNNTNNDYNNIKWHTKKIFGKRFSIKKEILKNRPLLFTSERYQCACCNERYQSNPDLLIHLREKHRSAKYLLRPHYKCGQCGVKFFRNSYLVRHCHFQHTPQKNYNNRNNLMRKL